MAGTERILLPTFRIPTLIHTRSANSKWLNEISHRHPLWIHPEDAEKLEIEEWQLVEDIEKLREHLQIDKWGMVLGGSWGSTLALAYAEAHPAKVRTLLLRGVFLFEPVRLRRPSSSTRERRRRGRRRRGGR